jgi:hypothetical protein
VAEGRNERAQGAVGGRQTEDSRKPSITTIRWNTRKEIRVLGKDRSPTYSKPVKLQTNYTTCFANCFTAKRRKRSIITDGRSEGWEWAKRGFLGGAMALRTEFALIR